jgi:outer membrane protein assembly factor BamB
MRRVISIVLFFAATVLVSADSPSWPCWRGANRDGVSTETGWDPMALKDGPKILWKADVGPGYSDVAIQNGRLYTMGLEKEKTAIICLNAATGKRIWRYSFQSHGEPMSTPAVDGDRVYGLGSGGEMLCLRSSNGKVVWQKHLERDLDALFQVYGWATSPLVDGDLLLINANMSGVCLDARTGAMIWNSPQYAPGWSGFGFYTSPVPCLLDGTRCVAFYGPIALNVVEASSGKLISSFVHGERTHPVADPILSGGRVFIDRPSSILFEMGSAGANVIWRNEELMTGITTAVLVDGHLYGWHKGWVSFPNLDWGALQKARLPLRCIEWETGKVMWESEKMSSISLTASDGKLILLEANGTLRIAEATPAGYHELSSADVLKGERKPRRFVTAPVLCGGLIYCRNYTGDLICIDVRR